MQGSKRQRSKKGTVCTHCRQLKFKCDAFERSPEPCSRCSNIDRRCIIDPHFRRVASKQRFESLRRELRDVRDELERHRAQPPPAPAMDTALPIQAISSEILDGIELQPQIITKLIDDYYDNFHPRFPILLDKAAFLSRYNSNRLLLWTMLAIACKESDQHSHLYASLVDPVRRLAGDLYSIQNRSFEAVQAFLLLCLWPFPFQRQVNDPVPMYAALATQVSYQLGLHRPSFPSDFTESNIPYDDPGKLARTRVWFGCFIVNFGIAGRFGTPFTIQPNHAIISHLTGPQSALMIPDTLLDQLRIAYIGSRAVTALGDNRYAEDGILPHCIPIVEAFESELIECSLSMKRNWSSHVEVLYHAQLLQLYFFGLRDEDSLDRPSRPDLSSKLVYGKTINTCIRILTLVSESEDSTFWPGLTKYSVFYGTLFALALTNLERHGSQQRVELLNKIRVSVTVLKSWSLFTNDHWSRLSAHIKYLLGKIEGADRGKQTRVKLAGWPISRDDSARTRKSIRTSVRSRMAASLSYEVVWTGKYEALREKEARNNLPANSNDNTIESVIDIPEVPSPALTFAGSDVTYEFNFNDSWADTNLFDVFTDWSNLVGTGQSST